MNFFIDTFKKLWQNDIKEHFQNGYITWEHQLQAQLYHLLKIKLTNEYEIWVEPVIYLKNYGLDKVSPDIIITKGNIIIAALELKVKTWESPLFKGDIEKLERLKSVPPYEKIELGFIPVTNNWENQRDFEEKKLKFTIDKQLLTIMAIIAKPDSDVFINKKNGIIIFKGFVGNNGEIIFE